MRVEYLVIINSGSDSFCGDTKSFNNLLESNSEIKIQDKILKFKNLEIDYEVQAGLIKSDNHRFYHVKFDCECESNESDERIDEFSKLLREIRTLLFMASENQNQVQTLWAILRTKLGGNNTVGTKVWIIGMIFNQVWV